MHRNLPSTLAGLTLTLWGCAMAPTVNLSVDTPERNTVQAWGYPSPDGATGSAWYNSMAIALDAAPPFVIVMPDGYRANSRQIDATMLAAHFAAVTADDRGARVASISHDDARGRYWMTFSLDAGGHATSLDLYACRHRMPGLLAAADGTRAFDFPITRDGIVALFGNPSRTGQDFVILGYSCEPGA